MPAYSIALPRHTFCSVCLSHLAHITLVNKDCIMTLIFHKVKQNLKLVYLIKLLFIYKSYSMALYNILKPTTINIWKQTIWVSHKKTFQMV